MAVALARRYGWDYWQVMALPRDYLDELIISHEIEWEQAQKARETAEKEKEKEAKIVRLRSQNLSVLRKMGLKAVA